jgi:hypothetical protein
MTPERLIAMVDEVHGILRLKKDGRIHLELPASCAQLAAELRAQKEQIRAILRDRENAARPRKAPRQAPAPQQPPQPTYITPACTYDAYPHAHVHRPSPEPTNVLRMPGEALWPWLKEEVIAAQKRRKRSGEAQQAPTKNGAAAEPTSEHSRGSSARLALWVMRPNG